MRREHDVGPELPDGGDRLGDRHGRKGCLGTLPDPACLQDPRVARDPPHLEDLRPAEAEPAVADDQAALVGRELPRDGLHPERAAARHDDGGARVVDRLHDPRDVAHDALEALRHVVEGPVRVDDRILEQTFGIRLGQ